MKQGWVIPDSFLKAIQEQAEKEYPSECCGIIFKRNEKYTRIIICRNVQDEYHAKDPGNFPRTSKNAYFIDPKQLLELQKEARVRGEEIGIIYHSHIDAPAEFSQEDYRIAVSEGKPNYPHTRYLIASVMAGKTVSMNLFYWDSAKQTYLSS